MEKLSLEKQLKHFARMLLLSSMVVMLVEKKKLLEKQKKGKKRMKQFGNVEIPQTAFFEALKIGDSD